MIVKWQGGRDMRSLAKLVQERGDRLKSDARDAQQMSVEHGAFLLQDLLERATTRTGDRRVRAGGVSAGRHDTGNMVASVSENSDSPRKLGNVMWMDWGWFAQYMEAYFRDQDLGAGKIPAANALWGSFAQTREEFRGRLTNVVRWRGPGL